MAIRLHASHPIHPGRWLAIEIVAAHVIRQACAHQDDIVVERSLVAA